MSENPKKFVRAKFQIHFEFRSVKWSKNCRNPKASVYPEMKSLIMTHNDGKFRALIGPTGESSKVRIILSYTRFT